MGELTPPRPLRASDNLAAFDCGRDSLNLWLRRHAWRNQSIDASRTNVVCDTATGAVIAFVSLSAAQIERAFLPKSDQRNRPDPLPALLLGQLAVDQRYHGQGLARSLIRFAFATAVRMSAQAGCFCVLTHPLDDRLRQFHRDAGFEDLPFDPNGGMAVRIAALRLAGF